MRRIAAKLGTRGPLRRSPPSLLGGESEMLKDYVPPTRAEECRNTAEILRELAAQLQFYDTRELLMSLADDLDCRTTQFEHQTSRHRVPQKR